MSGPKSGQPPGWELFSPDPEARPEGELESADSIGPAGPVAPEAQGSYLEELLAVEARPKAPAAGSPIRVGLDLGTASIVLAVLSGAGEPLGLAREEAAFIRDGLVVDFSGARNVALRLKRRLEEAMGVVLDRAAIAVPPGTGERDAATHRFVCESAGLEATEVFEEPDAANFFLGVNDGAIADLGGGTTGVALIKDGRTVVSFDQATGGHHLSLVLAGHLHVPLERAENIKRDPERRSQVAPLVAPVLSKMGTIIREGLSGREVPVLYLVGGTAAAPGAGEIIARETGFPTRAILNPELVTPAGIALGARPCLAQSL
jgi:ethanolamine utilization protein EutJ